MSESKTIQFLEERLESNPKSLLFAILADIYLQQGRLEDAVELCSQGVIYNPDYITGKYILAKAYSMQGENEKAEAELKQVLTHDRHYLSAHKMMADIMIRMGWENSAIMHYKEILRIDPHCNEIRESMNALSISDEDILKEDTPQRSSKIKSNARKSYISATPKREVKNIQDDAWLDQLDETFPTEEEKSQTKTTEPPKQEIILDPSLEDDIVESNDDVSKLETESLEEALEAVKQQSILSDDKPLSETESFDVPQGLSPEELERALDELLDTSDMSDDEIKEALPSESNKSHSEIMDQKSIEKEESGFELPEMDDALDEIFKPEEKTEQNIEPSLDDLELESTLDDILIQDEEPEATASKTESPVQKFDLDEVEESKETNEIITDVESSDTIQIEDDAGESKAPPVVSDITEDKEISDSTESETVSEPLPEIDIKEPVEQEESPETTLAESTEKTDDDTILEPELNTDETSEILPEIETEEPVQIVEESIKTEESTESAIDSDSSETTIIEKPPTEDEITLKSNSEPIDESDSLPETVIEEPVVKIEATPEPEEVPDSEVQSESEPTEIIQAETEIITEPESAPVEISDTAPETTENANDEAIDLEPADSKMMEEAPAEEEALPVLPETVEDDINSEPLPEIDIEEPLDIIETEMDSIETNDVESTETTPVEEESVSTEDEIISESDTEPVVTVESEASPEVVDDTSNLAPEETSEPLLDTPETESTSIEEPVTEPIAETAIDDMDLDLPDIGDALDNVLSEQPDNDRPQNESVEPTTDAGDKPSDVEEQPKSIEDVLASLSWETEPEIKKPEKTIEDTNSETSDTDNDKDGLKPQPETEEITEEIDVDQILDNIMASQEVIDAEDDDYDSVDEKPEAKSDKKENIPVPKIETTEIEPDITPEALQSNPLFVDGEAPKEKEEKTVDPLDEALPQIPDIPEDSDLPDTSLSSFDLTPAPPGADGYSPNSKVDIYEDLPSEESLVEESDLDLKESKLVSPTLGEIYAAQGEYNKAIKVYETLLEKNPDEKSYKDKINELKKKIEEKNTE